MCVLRPLDNTSRTHLCVLRPVKVNLISIAGLSRPVLVNIIIIVVLGDKVRIYQYRKLFDSVEWTVKSNFCIFITEDKVFSCQSKGNLSSV
jgi:hypothetical protein